MGSKEFSAYLMAFVLCVFNEYQSFYTKSILTIYGYKPVAELILFINPLAGYI